MAPVESIPAVLECYPSLGPLRRIRFWANAGGFSGALLWQIEREAGNLCLRRWPLEHPTEERLKSMHHVLIMLKKCGLAYIPAPLLSHGDKSFITHAGHFWELTPWMPGSADFRKNPSRTRLTNVMQAIARVHRETQAFSPSLQQVCPTLLARREQLHRLLNGGADQLTIAVERHGERELQVRGRRLLSYFCQRAPVVAASLGTLQSTLVPVFPVIRDLWHDHIFFSGDEVTGIVDFGAMRVDSAACDLSRLLGSLVGNDPDAWEFARQAYDSIRPVSTDEWKLARALDEANVTLAGLNWLDWICVQGRIFENCDAIYSRLDDILLRLGIWRHPPPA